MEGQGLIIRRRKTGYKILYGGWGEMFSDMSVSMKPKESFVVQWWDHFYASVLGGLEEPETEKSCRRNVHAPAYDWEVSTHTKDRTRNEHIRAYVEVADIRDKIVNHRLRCFAHAILGDYEGKESTWKQVVMKDLTLCGVNWNLFGNERSWISAIRLSVRPWYWRDKGLFE